MPVNFSLCYLDTPTCVRALLRSRFADFKRLPNSPHSLHSSDPGDPRSFKYSAVRSIWPSPQGTTRNDGPQEVERGQRIPVRAFSGGTNEALLLSFLHPSSCRMIAFLLALFTGGLLVAAQVRWPVPHLVKRKERLTENSLSPDHHHHPSSHHPSSNLLLFHQLRLDHSST